MVKSRLSGLKNIYVAPLTGGTYGAPVAISGAKSIEAELTYDSIQFYSDDVMDTNEKIFAGGEGTLTVSALTLDEHEILFGHTYSDGGVLIKTTDIQPELAVMFERGKLGSNGKMLYVLYAVKFSPVSLNAATREGSADEEVVELSFTLRETAENDVMYIVDSGDPAAVPAQVTGWFTEVQKQGVVAGVSIQAQAQPTKK